MSKIQNYLQDELDKRGWSMSEMGRRAGISPAQVANVVGGRSQAGADFCIGIARALQVSPVHLLELAGVIPRQPQPADPEARRLLDAWYRLSEDERRVLLALLERASRR